MSKSMLRHKTGLSAGSAFLYSCGPGQVSEPLRASSVKREQ